MPANPPPTSDPSPPARLLDEVSRLAAELSSGGRKPAVTLDSNLERDLGLDSLGRVELLRRCEKAFGVRLGEEVLTSVETPRDLLGAIGRASGTSPGAESHFAASVEIPLDAGEIAPESTRTLLEVLDWHVARHPERRHLLFYPGDAEPEELTYAGLDRRARAVAAGLARLGIKPKAAVALMLPSGTDYFAAFLGVLRAGAVPVPLYPPARKSQIEDHLRRQAGILTTARAKALITFQEVMPLARLLGLQVDGLRVVSVPDLEADRGAAGPNVDVRSDDLAFLQFTSGSTGQPKGVMLTHANLLANLRAIGKAVAIGPGDAVVSWLPLYHDMGLIGTWMGSLYFAMPLALMSPLTFLSRPVRWLELIHHHRATLSAAPNFAYELCLGKIDDADLEKIEGFDLSSWRAALNGAEPVSPETMRRFTDRFARFGFRPETMFPVYGLAENSLAVTFPPLGRPPAIDEIDRATFSSEGKAQLAKPDDSGALRFPSCGLPLPTVDLRIADEAGRELPERRQGRVQFRGPSATAGYFENPEATARLIANQHGEEWLDSGDLGYLAAGELYVTGRSKDIIFRAGRNLYPHELEQAVGEIPGLRRGCVAVFGSPDPKSGTERVIVLAETRERDPAERERLREEIQKRAIELLGTPADDVALAPPQTVPKTSSGKIRRSSAREIYESGRFVGTRSVGLQMARLAVTGVFRRSQRALGRIGETLWAAWFWTVGALVTIPVWLAVVLAPGLGNRRKIARLSARIAFGLAGVPIRTDTAPKPDGPCLYVANHQSYLDAIALTAALPSNVAFVAKRELAGSWFPRLLLARLGTLFVERFDAAQGAGETAKIAEAIRTGHSIAIFPEGTFHRAPGLAAFRLGAFNVAAETGAPVVPVALRGTRSLLRGGSWMPRRTPIHVAIRPEISPQGNDLANAVVLRDAARAEVLAASGEPDAGDRFLELPTRKRRD
ncbi:MAG TPA: AMP-binding protein [Thermoanaerobaculia bacterium]|nr:AMP-binding protein [Thermoanaerobaculia bacterium]